MTDNKPQPDVAFYQLVMSLHAGAMQSMGKIASPLTGKVERDLEAAKMSIDMLEMLQKKTSGNLIDDEKSVLNRFLYELRMNYVDEVNKGESEPDTEEKNEEKPETKPEGKEADRPSDEKPTSDSN